MGFCNHVRGLIIEIRSHFPGGMVPNFECDKRLLITWAMNFMLGGWHGHFPGGHDPQLSFDY